MGNKRKRQAQEVLSVASAAKKKPKEIKPSITASSLPPIVLTPFVENPKGIELKREVQLYDQLSSQDVSERLKAADAVVSGLLAGAGASEAVVQRHLERRLFRGLASGRKAARLGFSVALTEVLAQLLGNKQPWKGRYPSLTFEKVLDILKAKTKPEGDLSGQEERDHAFGLLFGLQCFVRATVLFNSADGRWEKICESLIQLAKRKPWMREECGWVVVEALGQMMHLDAEATLEKFQIAGLAASPEGVGVWLTARKRFPNMKFPSKPWGHNGNPLEHLSALAKVLKESSSTSNDESGELAQQTGNWHPQLHFVWDIVLDEFTGDSKVEVHDSRDNFEDFWKVVVDESLFSSSASPERKFWGFLLFQRILRDAARYPKILKDIFTQNFMRCLINHIAHEDRFLHRAADRCIKILLQATESNPSIISTIIPRLISGNGIYNFDQVTKTKTIYKLLSQIEGDHVGSIIDDLVLPIKNIKTLDSVRDADIRRQMFGDYILSIIKHVNTADLTKNNTWVKTHALPQLASLAYSNADTFIPPMSEKSRAVLRSRLSSAFAHLISGPEGMSYPCGLLLGFEPDAVDMDEDISAAKDKALAVMRNLMKKVKKAAEYERKPLQTLAMLYALVIFQLYNGESDAISLLDELKVCYDKLILRKDSISSDPEASVVLAELLLSLLSKQSVLLRKVAEQAFTAFSGDMTREGLKILVDVLKSSENVKGQQELFDQEDEQSGHRSEDDGLDSDVEIIDTNGLPESDGSDEAGDEGEESVVDGEEDDGDEDGDEDGDGDVNEDEGDDAESRELENALAKALGTHRADEDLKEESSDGDADITDSEMMALDSKLAEIFSRRKRQTNKKQEKKDARETVVNFKSHVLDLIEIFVKKQTASAIAFDLLLPLLGLMRTTTAKHLSDKAHKVIASFAKALKGLKIEYDKKEVKRLGRLQMLKQIHDEASKDPSHAFAKAVSTASLLVAMTLYRASKKNIKKIATVYRDTQVAWLEGGMKMQASFFHDWVNWCQSHAS